MLKLYVWRHPKPNSVGGLCYGQTDVAVDKRKLKRLANRIDRYVKRNRMPKVIWVSHLSRSRTVGELLQRRGFECHIDASLAESHFGEWEGKPWTQINKSEIDKWCDNFAIFAPTGGESLTELFQRVSEWLHKQHHKSSDTPVLAVGHAGWITTAKIISDGKDMPQKAKQWPKSVSYNELTVLKYAF